MNCCTAATDAHFGAKHAERDLKRYLADGPDRTTGLIIDGVRRQCLGSFSLLDIGAGIGVIHHELLEDSCSGVVHTDLSSTYMDTAVAESERRGHADRIEFVHADFATSAAGFSDADVVTLDRVVCCYPDYRALLGGATRKARRILALAYPKNRWYIRLGFRLDNLKRVIKRDPFRAFVHPTREIEALIEEAGFHRSSSRDLFIWRVSVYSKNGVG